MATAFKVTAVPDVSGKIKQRGFCLDENGVITADPNGGTNCTEPLK
jgi:type IV pilus assembly protein PilA